MNGYVGSIFGDDEEIIYNKLLCNDLNIDLEKAM